MNQTPRFGTNATVGRRESVSKSGSSDLMRAQRARNRQEDRANNRATARVTGSLGVAGAGGLAMYHAPKIASEALQNSHAAAADLNAARRDRSKAKQALADVERRRKGGLRDARSAFESAETTYSHRKEAASKVGEALRVAQKRSGFVRSAGAMTVGAGLALTARNLQAAERRRNGQMMHSRPERTRAPGRESREEYGFQGKLPSWDEQGNPLKRKSRAQEKAHPNSLYARGLAD